MARLFGILVAIFTLSACSSGVSNSGGGAAGTNCGSIDLVCTATLTVQNPAIDVLEVQEGEAAEGEEPEEILISPGTDFGTLEITLADPLGRFANVFQGVTFDTFDIIYDSGDGGAPNLGTRRVRDTLTIFLDSVDQTLTDSESNNTGSGSVQIPIADQVTKTQFRDQASLSTVYPYVVTVRAAGRDIATNSSVVVIARAHIEIGDFAD